MIAFMRTILAILLPFLVIWPAFARASSVSYSLTVTTAYATSDPFANRLDQAWTAFDTGYFQISNTGSSVFTGSIGTVAVSAFAGDLSFNSDSIVLSPGGSVSFAIPDDASDVGGFNGPAYFFRPGVEISLNGTITEGGASQSVSLLIADADIHSGVPRTDPYGLTSDSFVLQGGDPWGFDTGDDFELSQANGVYVFAQTMADVDASQSVPEPNALIVLASSLPFWAAYRVRDGRGRWSIFMRLSGRATVFVKQRRAEGPLLRFRGV
jgi:hypothetical protein